VYKTFRNGFEILNVRKKGDINAKNKKTAIDLPQYLTEWRKYIFIFNIKEENMKKKPFRIILNSLVMVLIIFTYIQAAIILNDEPPPDGRVDNTGVNKLIIGGTSLLLQSNSYAFLLLNEVEIAEINGFDHYYALDLTTTALRKLQKAKARYLEVVGIRKNATYSDDFNQKYNAFDYERFALENNLNQEIMAEVAFFLKRSDIKGVFARAVEKIDDILYTLREIKTIISEGRQPDIQLFWTLLQRYNTLGLFGNYATIMFNTI
jgi:hypothetical protein